MNCYVHSDQEAVAYCRTCGKAMCQNCQRTANGTVFCEEHLPAAGEPAGAPAAPPLPPSSVSPGLAFVLGLIPGVGAIYNAQYVKGLIHVIILGTLISIVSSGAAGGLSPLFGLLIAVFYIYMPFEAYHTAKRRQRGEMVDEFSSLIAMKPVHSAFPVGPIVLIALGVLFLLNTLDLLDLRDVLRWWPLLLIGLGVYMLFCRLTGQGNCRNAERREARHEQ